ncbi:MAG TPA: BLUF domain-containing protein [Methyloceanibacter sp.]|nr:BLUF domain-containing protein [Methyloceanibacter sp.]
MTLLRLAYISKSLLAGDPREREHIADILMSSRRNNEETQVTGALLATEGRFAQVLEGEPKAVEEVYGRITCVPRHQDIVLLLTEPIAARQFPEWAMAYIGPSQPAEDAVARVTRTLPPTDDGDAARDLVAFMSTMIDGCSDAMARPNDEPAPKR